jgi:hypothetical protein
MINPPEAKPRNPLAKFKGFGLLAVGVTAAIAGVYALDRSADANIVAQMPPSMAQVMVQDSMNIIAGAESGFMYGMMGTFEKKSDDPVGRDFRFLSAHFKKSRSDVDYVKAGVASQLEANLSEDDLVVLGLEVVSRHEKMLSLLNDAAASIPKESIGTMNPHSLAALHIINAMSGHSLGSEGSTSGAESEIWQALNVAEPISVRLGELIDHADAQIISIAAVEQSSDAPLKVSMSSDEADPAWFSEWKIGLEDMVGQRLTPHLSTGSSPFIQVANAINMAPNRIFGDSEGRNLARANISDPFEEDVRPGLVQDLVDVVVGKHPDDPFTTVEIEPGVATPEPF